MNNLQEFDLMALAEFGCRMCFNAKQERYKNLYGKEKRPCVWKNEDLGAKECYGCTSLQATLHNFLKETL